MDRFQTCSCSNRDRAGQPVPGYWVHTVPPANRLMSCNHNKHSWQCKSEARPGNVDRRPVQTSPPVASCGPRSPLYLYSIKKQNGTWFNGCCCIIKHYFKIVFSRFQLQFKICGWLNSLPRKLQDSYPSGQSSGLPAARGTGVGGVMPKQKVESQWHDATWADKRTQLIWPLACGGTNKQTT